MLVFAEPWCVTWCVCWLLSELVIIWGLCIICPSLVVLLSQEEDGGWRMVTEQELASGSRAGEIVLTDPTLHCNQKNCQLQSEIYNFSWWIINAIHQLVAKKLNQQVRSLLIFSIEQPWCSSGLLSFDYHILISNHRRTSSLAAVSAGPRSELILMRILRPRLTGAPKAGPGCASLSPQSVASLLAHHHSTSRGPGVNTLSPVDHHHHGSHHYHHHYHHHLLARECKYDSVQGKGWLFYALFIPDMHYYKDLSKCCHLIGIIVKLWFRSQTLFT